MPVMVKQEDGTEIEAFTADEVAAKAKETSDAAIAAETERLREEHEAQLLGKEEELSTTKEALKKLQDKDMNFENLRKSKSLTPEQEAEAKKVAADLKATNDRLDAIEKQPFEQAKSSFVKNNIGADKDLGEKFDYYFKKLASGIKTLEDYDRALAESLNLASGGTKQPNTSGAMSRVSVNDNFGGESNKVESQDSQNFGALLGLTPEAKKIYAPIAKGGGVPIAFQSPPKEK